MIKFGENRYIYHGNSNKHLVQGLNNVKDIKLLGKEEYFLNKYFDNFSNSIKNRVFMKHYRLYQNQFLKLYSYSICWFGPILISTGNLSSIVTTTFIFNATRLLPSIIRITNAFSP